MCIFEVGLKYWSEIRNPGSATPGHTAKTDVKNQSTGPYEQRSFWCSRRPEPQPRQRALFAVHVSSSDRSFHAFPSICAPHAFTILWLRFAEIFPFSALVHLDIAKCEETLDYSLENKY